MIYWALFGLIYLVRLSYQDIKNRMIDDRFNYLMIGATLPLYFIYQPNWWWFLLVMVMSLFLSYLFSKYRVFGSGDIKTVFWTFTGFGIIGIDILKTYAIIFTILYVVFLGTIKIIDKVYIIVDLPRLPALPLFLISFITTCSIHYGQVLLWNIP